MFRKDYRPVETITPDDLWAFEAFCFRATALLDNWEDLSKEIDLSKLMIHEHENGHFLSNEIEINPHRAKGLYLDFRPFELQGDAMQFFGVVKKVNRYFRDDKVHDLTDRLKAKWQEAPGVIHASGYSPEEYMNILFNSSSFHTKDQTKFRKMQELLSRSNNTTLHLFLLLDIRHRLPCIKFLSRCLEGVKGADPVLTLEV